MGVSVCAWVGVGVGGWVWVCAGGWMGVCGWVDVWVGGWAWVGECVGVGGWVGVGVCPTNVPPPSAGPAILSHTLHHTGGRKWGANLDLVTVQESPMRVHLEKKRKEKK